MEKLRKDQVGYTPIAPVGTTVCWVCKHAREGMTCEKVLGEVERTGTCNEATHILRRVSVRDPGKGK